MVRPEVIARLSKDFIPVSLRAPSLHVPVPTPEGKLLKGLHDAALAPQGMFVLNSDGRVLTAVLMFDNTRAISDFLQLSIDEFRRHPRSATNIEPRRFVKYPSIEAPPAERRPESVAFSIMCQSSSCSAPADPVFAGDLTIDMVARSLDADGNLSRDTLHQEHYSQDEVVVPKFIERAVINIAKSAQSSKGAMLPESFTNLFIQHAYLGHLDVQPLSSPRRARVDLRKAEFRISAVPNRPGLFRISGASDVRAQDAAAHEDGATFRNEVTLDWTGYMHVSGDRIAAIYLLAEGTQDLYWRTDAPINVRLSADQLVSMLPAGKPIALKQRIVVGFNQRESRAHGASTNKWTPR